MELNLVVLDCELVAQHLHELDVGAARGAGGNAHLRRRQRDVKRRPDKAAENDRSQDGYKPGVAEERLIRFRTVCPSASRLIAEVNGCAGAAEEPSGSLFRPSRCHNHSFMASGGRCEGPGGMVKS
jgi:hypothetical protein